MASETEGTKLIVLGDINGQLKPVLKRLTMLQTKNNFAFALVAGNLFSDDDDTVSDLLAGDISIPLPTYFTVGTSPLPQRIIEKIEKDEEICPNLHYLGKRSTTKTSEGVRIVALGGQLDATVVGGLSKEQVLPFHTVGDAKALHGANTADILLTATWPATITRGSKALKDGLTAPVGGEHISDLCAALKPRYHFSVSPSFSFEREPFFYSPSLDAPDARPITRFISLAAHGVSKPQKAVYALSLPKLVNPATPLPEGCTASPFTLRPSSKKRSADDGEQYSRYGNGNYGGNGYKRSKGRRPQYQPRPDECFLCLANPNSANHLVCAIGDESIVTIAKGPLTTSTTYAELGINFPAHALIIPLSHAPTLSLLEDVDGSRDKTFVEMKKFKDALQSMISELSHNKLGAVTYEISKADGVHIHWQFIPMPAETISKGLVELAFRVEASDSHYPDFEVRDPGLGLQERDFFRVWIYTPPTEDAPDGSTKCLIMPFGDINFSVQFGRKVLAKLLGLQNRFQWKECAQSPEEEMKDSAAFVQAFKVFDPSS